MIKKNDIPDILKLSAITLIKKIKKKEITSREYCQICIDRVDLIESEVQAFAYFDSQSLLRKAEFIDNLLSRNVEIEEVEGIIPHTLCGLPVGIKDIFNTEDMPTCMGSPIWDGFTPGNDARAVTRIKRAGGLIAAKTVTAEFAVHHPGPTRNPHNLEYSPGTSSSGSAAAVASYMMPLAIGTQTAGSTIRPASYCGIYGFKPSFGVIPRTGVLKTLDTLDHVSMMARHISDIEVLFNVLRVYGWNYPLVEKYLDADKRKTKKEYNLAFVKTHTWDTAESYVKDKLSDYIDKIEKVRRINVVEMELPRIFKESHHVHSIIYEKALSYYFKDEVKNNPDLVSSTMKKMTDRGNKISLESYRCNIDKQVSLREALTEFYEKNDIDAIICHSTAGVAPYGLDGIEKPDPCLMWTLCGAPSLNLPLFRNNDHMPFGAQLAGKRFTDYSLLNLAKLLMEV